MKIPEVKSETVRPSKELLNLFYKIVHCDASIRLASIKELLNSKELEEHKDYIFGRVISGLVSPRVASRHGYAVLLAAFLEKFFADFPVDKLFEIADKNFDISCADSSNGLIAYQLLCTSCYFSGKYNEDAKAIVKKQLEIADSAPFLKPCVVDAISKFSASVDSATFKEKILLAVRHKLRKSLNEMSGDEFYLFVSLANTFPKIIAKENPTLLSDKKRIKLSDADFPILVEMIKAADKTFKFPLIVTILKVGRSNEEFLKYYKNVFDEYAWHGDLSKAVERYFHLLNQLFNSSQVTAAELAAIFDEMIVKCIRKYAHRVDPKFRHIHLLIQTFLQTVQQRFTTDNFSDQSEILRILNLLDTVEDGDFDTKVGVQIRFSEFLISRLNDESFEIFLDKAITEQKPWAIRRVEHSYKTRPPDVKVKIIKCLIRLSSNIGRNNEATFTAVCSLLADMFVVKFRRGEFLSTSISDEDVEVLRRVVDSFMKRKTKGQPPIDEEFRCLEVFSWVLRILGASCDSSSPSTEKYQYLDDAREVRQCARHFQSEVAVELILSVLIHPNRMHKALVCYVFDRLCRAGRISATDAASIAETIGKTDDQIAGDDDEEQEDSDAEEDDEFKPITKEELQKLKQKRKREEENEKLKMRASAEEARLSSRKRPHPEDEDDTDAEGDDDDEMDDEEDEDEESGHVNPQLLSDIKKALGPAAFSEQALDAGEDSADDMMEMDEAEMARLDEALAEAFRKNSSKEKKLRHEELRIFRGKLFDLLGIYLHIVKDIDEEEAQMLETVFDDVGKRLKKLKMKEFLTKLENVKKTLAKKLKNKTKKSGEDVEMADIEKEESADSDVDTE